MRRMIAVAAGLALAVPVLTSGAPASAAPTASTCQVQAGALTTGGDTENRYVVATSPVTASPATVMAKQAFGGRSIALSSQWVWDDDFGDEMSLNGHVVSGGAMYQANQWVEKGTGGKVLRSSMTRIGGGWDVFRTLTQSWSLDDPSWRVYALRNDGTLFRWHVNPTNDGVEHWEAAGSYPGFSAVKAVTLLSRTSTYDTLLATTRGGALYTIHIPTSSPMKPVVKVVRTRTWQGFETLIAHKCGVYGTILLGIDKDTDSAYLYAVGRFTGISTVIQSVGKVPATFADNVYAGLKDPGTPLNGE